MNDKKLLKMLEQNAYESKEVLASKLGASVDEVEAAIARLEKDKVILGYTAMIDWDKTKEQNITAMIEIKVIPTPGEGFDKVARRISKYPQVKSVTLMSATYDILVSIEGKTLQEIAMFVAAKLATMAGVQSTATHFMLKKYKDKGIIYDIPEGDMRALYNL